MRRLIVVAFAALTIANSTSAAVLCGPWVPQTSGTSWRICSDGQDLRYCEKKTRNVISRMVCP